MPKKKSGRVLVVFLVITAVLMGTLAAIAVFFFRLELDERRSAEANLAERTSQVETFQTKIDELQKSVFLLEEKNKEADDRINGLLDELELQKGLREELKNETAALREQVKKETEAKDKLRVQITQQETDFKQQIAQLNEKLSQEAVRYAELQAKHDALVKAPEQAPGSPAASGKIINVDNETGFIIISIGQEQGLTEGQVLSVHRNNKYIGDIKITRVQSGMSAADPVAPLTVKAIRESDQVTTK